LFNVVETDVDQVIKKFADAGVGMVPFGQNTIRAVFHFQVDDEDLEIVLKTVETF
jgi:hypothetical protein